MQMIDQINSRPAPTDMLYCKGDYIVPTCMLSLRDFFKKRQYEMSYANNGNSFNSESLASLAINILDKINSTLYSDQDRFGMGKHLYTNFDSDYRTILDIGNPVFDHLMSMGYVSFQNSYDESSVDKLSSLVSTYLDSTEFLDSFCLERFLSGLEKYGLVALPLLADANLFIANCALINSTLEYINSTHMSCGYISPDTFEFVVFIAKIINDCDNASTLGSYNYSNNTFNEMMYVLYQCSSTNCDYNISSLVLEHIFVKNQVSMCNTFRLGEIVNRSANGISSNAVIELLMECEYLISDNNFFILSESDISTVSRLMNMVELHPSDSLMNDRLSDVLIKDLFSLADNYPEVPSWKTSVLVELLYNNHAEEVITQMSPCDSYEEVKEVLDSRKSLYA